MAVSSCPKCSNHQFEMVVNEPYGSRVKVMFVQCRSCGCVVGSTTWHDVPSLLERMAEKLGIRDLLR